MRLLNAAFGNAQDDGIIGESVMGHDGVERVKIIDIVTYICYDIQQLIIGE